MSITEDEYVAWLEAEDEAGKLKPLTPAAEYFAAIPAYQEQGRAHAVPWGIKFLDDSLDAIYANDLVLIGADTGAGKTTLARILALQATRAGRKVAHFALEAHDGEMQQALAYSEVQERAWREMVEGRELLTFGKWANGRAHPAIHRLDEGAIVKAKSITDGHYMRYRGDRFGTEDMRREFLANCRESDLVVFDHVHYVDSAPNQNENQAVTEVAKVLRDSALELGRPVVAVAHLRKRGANSRGGALVPSIDDFHGSSNLVKNATRIVTLSPAYDRDNAPSGSAFTYMKTLKDRWDGVKGIAAVLRFDMRRIRYEDRYLLGRFDATGSKFEDFTRDEVPEWCSCPEGHSLPGGYQ